MWTLISLPLQMTERLLRAQPVANHVKARQSLIERAVTWLATESGWGRGKGSAICSGKLCGGFTIFLSSAAPTLLVYRLCVRLWNSQPRTLSLIITSAHIGPHLRIGESLSFRQGCGPMRYLVRSSQPTLLDLVYCYTSIIWTVAFKTLELSQGSVATHFRCGGIFSDSIITHFLLILRVK